MGSKAGTFLQLRLKAFPHLLTLDYTTVVHMVHLRYTVFESLSCYYTVIHIEFRHTALKTSVESRQGISTGHILLSR